MIEKVLFRYLSKGLVYFRNGTLLEHLQIKLHDYIKQKRKAWWHFQIGKRSSFETRIQRGVRIRLNFDSKLSHAIYCNDFEIQERVFLNAFLRRDDVFVDVGANIGLFSLIAAYRVGKHGKVYSFEPTFEIYQRLCENIKLNNFSNIYSYQWALSDVESEGSLFQSQNGYDAWNSLAEPVAGEAFTTALVQCKRLDDFVRENGLFGNVTLMKVDVEGWETRVLKGAHEMLSRKDAPVLQVEFTEEAAWSAGSSCKELYHLLEKFGYQMYTYDTKSRTLVPDPLRESYPYMNLIAVKDLHYVNNRLRKKSSWNCLGWS